MNLTRLALLSLVLLAFHSARAEEKPLASRALAGYVAKLSELTLVTPELVSMRSWVALLCRQPTSKDRDHADLLGNYHALYKVYVTPNGADAMKDDKAVFPQGAVILKQKFAKKTDTVPELYTGMLKREKGYNPDCGDWEFFLVDGAGKAVTARGKIESCMDCHKNYSTSDFVTKKYMNDHR